MQKARQLAAAHGLKYVPVHHMEAHALVARACRPVAFPFLCLLVSGGHNLLVVVRGVGRYTLLGSTLDDAVGARTLETLARAPPVFSAGTVHVNVMQADCTAADCTSAIVFKQPKAGSA